MSSRRRGLVGLEQVPARVVVHVEAAGGGGRDGLTAAAGPAGARRRIGHVLEVGEIRGLLRAGVAHQRIHVPAVALPVHRHAVLAVVSLVDPLLAQHLVLGGGVGHITQHHHAVLGQRSGIVGMDGVERTAAGGRIGGRIVLVLGAVIAADHRVEDAVAHLVLEHDPVGLLGIVAIGDVDARIAQQHGLRLGAAGARGSEEARGRPEVDARGGVGAVGALGLRVRDQRAPVTPGIGGEEGKARNTSLRSL
ncbi:hypothetical protein G6F31_015991 [Rhizopus arrhizus]|nr:hypothetical protein G6F31_015991 [Rhizopus arrhizus]